MFNIKVVGRGFVNCYKLSKEVSASYSIDMLFKELEFPNTPVKDEIFNSARHHIKTLSKCDKAIIETIHVNDKIYYINHKLQAIHIPK